MTPLLRWNGRREACSVCSGHERPGSVSRGPAPRPDAGKSNKGQKRVFQRSHCHSSVRIYDVGVVHVCRVHHQARRPAAPTGSWPLRSRREIRYVSARQASITCGRGRAAGVVLGAATGRRGSRSMAPTLLALELDVLSTMTEYTAVHSAVRDATCSKFVLDRLAQMRPCCASQDHTLC